MSDIPAPAPAEEPDTNPLAGILGNAWGPTAIGWSWIKAQGAGGVVHVLILDTATGRTGLAFSEDGLSTFIRQAQEQLSGLILPTYGGLG